MWESGVVLSACVSVRERLPSATKNSREKVLCESYVYISSSADLGVCVSVQMYFSVS